MENNQKHVEANALAPIPQSERQGWVSLALVQAGICVCASSFLEGALLAEAMPLGEAILSGSLGNLLVVIFMTIIGFQGSDLGLASCTLSESSFGKKGARYLVSVVFAINLVGWFGITNEICGDAFTNFMAETFGINIPLIVSNILWGLIMLITAVYGMRAMEKLNAVSIPFLLIVMAVGTYLAIKEYGIDAASEDVERSMSFMSGVSLAFDFYAVGVVTAADVSRFQKNRAETAKSTIWGVLPVAVITLSLGAVLTKISGEYDISMVLIQVGLPFIGILSIILSTWTTNSSNIYSGGLDVVMAFNLPDNRRREVTVVAGIIGTLLGAFGVLDHIESFLSFLAYLVCPVGGAMIADYWIVGKGKPENWHSVEGTNWTGVISWIIGAVCAYLIGYAYSGILIALVAYIVVEKFIPSQSREGNNAKAE
ncbi:MAG: purine-cytosine permease family protein [Anaerovoracaceae bacterium]